MARPSIVALSLILLAAVCLAADRARPQPRVSLELVTEKNFPITGAQQWHQVFADLGVNNLRIREATGRDEVSVEKSGGGSPSYQVVGRLKADNSLQLPNGRFTPHDTARLKKWLEDLADQGIEGVTQARSAFGMTASQLREVNDDLRQGVSLTTQDAPLAQVLDKIAGSLRFKIEFDPGTRQALGEAKSAEELLGISSGTALAALLRPQGLVLRPERPSGGTIRYRVSKPVSGQEAWPVGWKPEAQERKLVPGLFEFATIEIEATPLPEALDALREPLQIPFLWDHNALALHGIDPGRIEVKLPAKKLTYSLVLQRVLSQARLKKELRVDEAGKPFVWITTVKPS